MLKIFSYKTMNFIAVLEKQILSLLTQPYYCMCYTVL